MAAQQTDAIGDNSTGDRLIGGDLRISVILMLVAGALPLLAYPMVLVAGVMSLAAERQGDEPALQMALMAAFVLGTLAYPLVYAPCAAVAVATMRMPNRGLPLGFSIAPLGYLLLLVTLAFVLGAVELIH
jgi:hypothetical protein